jgi:hypothetical protein
MHAAGTNKENRVVVPVTLGGSTLFQQAELISLNYLQIPE